MSHRSLRLLGLAAAFSIAAGACDSNGGPTEVDIGLPVAGTTTRSVAATATDTFAFVAGRSGTVTIGMCGATGVNLDLAAGGKTATTSANCEQLDFAVEQGGVYR